MGSLVSCPGLGSPMGLVCSARVALLSLIVVVVVVVVVFLALPRVVS